MDLGLEGRVYIVTGASSGLGFSCAELLVQERARVVMVSRNRESITAAARRIGSATRTFGVSGDLGHPDTPTKCVQAALDRWGRLDGALISIGGPPPSSVAETTDDAWQSSFESIFLGMIRTAREVSKALEGEGGSIVFVLSSSAKAPIDGLAISNGFRPGLAMIAKTLADELGVSEIRVNSVLPGRIDTNRVRAIDASRGDDPAKVRAAAMARIPLRRYGSPEEFARAAVFLLSPAASYITGAAVPIDGGVSRAL